MKRLVTILGSILLALPAGAQEPPFPTKGNIELTVLFTAGSSADITARLVAEGMSKYLPGNVIVVNRPGAGGAIGYKHVASQKPDGYALVWNSNSISTTFHSGMLAFDYRAFDPVARVLVESPVLAVRADAPWKTLAEFLADARAHPGTLTVGNSGIGSHTHLASAALFKAADVEVIEVPYAAAQVVPDLIGGHIDAVVQLPGALSAPLKAGAVRLLAALIPQRDPALPDVPTALEQGVNVSLEAWRGVAAPRGTPAPVITALEAAIRKTVEAPEFARACEALGIHPAYMPAAEFGPLIAKDDAEISKLMQQIGLRVAHFHSSGHGGLKHIVTIVAVADSVSHAHGPLPKPGDHDAGALQFARQIGTAKMARMSGTVQTRDLPNYKLRSQGAKNAMGCGNIRGSRWPVA